MVEGLDASQCKQNTESLEVLVEPPALICFLNLQFSPRCLNQNVAANTRELANYLSLLLMQPKITDASSRASSKVPNGG